jgi:hypothetical protein
MEDTGHRQLCFARLSSIPYLRRPCAACTVRTAEHFARRFNAMADDPALAMLAWRCQRVYCAFKAVKRVSFPRHGHLHALVIVVSAYFAFRHSPNPPPVGSEWRHYVTSSKSSLGNGAGTLRQTLLVGNHANMSHHPAILMFQNVAVVHEIPHLRKRNAQLHWRNLAFSAPPTRY